MGLLIFLLILTSSCINTSASKPEANALLKWKTSLVNRNNPRLSSWALAPDNNLTGTINRNTSATPCTWYGVHCESRGNVEKLNLSASRLNGTLDHFNF